MAQFKQLSATTQVKVGAGKIKGIFVSAASATPTIAVYDSAASSTSDPKLIDTFTPAAATMYPLSGDDGGVWFNKGMYVVIGGTVSATIIYE